MESAAHQMPELPWVALACPVISLSMTDASSLLIPELCTDSA